MHRRTACLQISRGDELPFPVAFGEDEKIALLRPLVGAGRILSGTHLRGTAETGRGGERTEQQRSPRLLRARVGFMFRSAVGG